MKITVAHKLGKAEASQRVQGLMTQMKANYTGMVNNLEETWTENGAEFSFQAMGISVKGTLTIEAEAVEADISLPMFAMVFKDKIEAAFKQEAEKLLK